MRGGSSRYVVAVMVMGAVLLSMSAVGFKLSLPGRGTPRLVSDAAGVESNWQGTWYTLVDTGSGPSCTGVLGTEQWPATFAKDWVTGPVFATYSDNLCFGATIPVYVRQSGAYHFDLKNVDDGARLFDGNGNVLIEASCGSFNCPVQSGKDVNLVQGKGELGLQFWQYGGRASVSFLAQDTSIFRNGAPTAIFTYSPSTVLAGDSVSFSSTSVDPDGDSMNLVRFTSESDPCIQHAWDASGDPDRDGRVRGQLERQPGSRRRCETARRPRGRFARVGPGSAGSLLHVFRGSGHASYVGRMELRGRDRHPVGSGGVSHVRERGFVHRNLFRHRLGRPHVNLERPRVRIDGRVVRNRSLGFRRRRAYRPQRHCGRSGCCYRPRRVAPKTEAERPSQMR